MRYLLIAAVIFLIGILLSALPTGRQLRLARLRQRALRSGMQVRAHNSEQMTLLQGQVAYFRPLSDAAEHWRLMRVSRINSRQLEQGQELLHIASGRLGLDDWIEEGQVPVVSEKARQKLQLLLNSLPEGTDAVGVGSLGVFVIWDERAEAAALDAIVEMLQWLEAIA